ncbi:MAG: DUF3830 family protein [Firmicutes bacterium]|nr:DUF3830 family protein [Bacillota bacterium]
MKKISIYFPESNITVRASLLEEEEPELCQLLWEAVKEPLRMACHHTMSTGDVFVAFPRPPKHPPQTGTQAKPLGRKNVLWSDLQVGQLFWRGWNMGVAYGKCTEPLNPGGSVVAQVDEEDLDAFVEACQEVWNCCYFKHCLATIVVKREAD